MSALLPLATTKADIRTSSCFTPESGRVRCTSPQADTVVASTRYVHPSIRASVFSLLIWIFGRYREPS
jgi:hypothetical protein